MLFKTLYPWGWKRGEGKEKEEGERQKQKEGREGGKDGGRKKEWLQRKRNIWMNISLTDIIIKGGILGIFTFQVINFCHGCIFHNKQVWLLP